MIIVHRPHHPQLGSLLLVGLTFDQLRALATDGRPVALPAEPFKLGPGRIFIGAGGCEGSIRAEHSDCAAVVDLSEDDVDQLVDGCLATRLFSELRLPARGTLQLVVDESNAALLAGLREGGLLPAGVEPHVV
jgi:hypothetical protein